MAPFAVHAPLRGMRDPDPNIDAEPGTWFRRHGMALPVSAQARDDRPGDIVSWRLQGIGTVSERSSADSLRLPVIHHIGYGTQEQNVPFDWQISGHSAILVDRLRSGGAGPASARSPKTPPENP